MSRPEFQYYADYDWTKINPECDEQILIEGNQELNHIINEFETVIADQETHEECMAIIAYYSKLHAQLPLVFQCRDISHLKNLSTVDESEKKNEDFEICAPHEALKQESTSREDFAGKSFSTNEPREIEGYFVSNGKPYSMLSEVPLGQIATYQPLLCGGGRGKKKKGKPLNRRRRPPGNQTPGRSPQTMDCSPGNVYESSALMVTDATGALNIVIALNNPQQIFTGVTATGAQDLANNWDAYSVERVSMSTQIRAPITARQGEWNLICDHDSSPPSTAITQNLLLTYTDKRSYSSQASPRWSVVPRKLSQCEYISAPAADPEPAVIVSKGKYDWNTPPANGFMYVKLIGGPPSTNIGTIYVRVHVTAWYKRRLAVAVPVPSFVCPMLEEEDSSEESNEKVKKPTKKKEK